jgi:hypothetical protein
MRFLIDANMPRSIADLLKRYARLLVLELSEDTAAAFVLRAMESFVSQRELVEALSGCLAILEPARVRLRPPVS